MMPDTALNFAALCLAADGVANYLVAIGMSALAGSLIALGIRSWRIGSNE